MEQLIHAVNKEKNERFKKSWINLFVINIKWD